MSDLLSSPSLRWALGLAALLSGCQEYEVKEIADPNAPGPEIEVTPDRLDFGSVGLGERVELPFTIRSVGGAALELGALTLEAPGAYSLLSEADGALLNPGEETTVIVGYAPTATAESGEVHIASNDPRHADSIVWLNGAGQIPLLQIDPNPLDFAYRETGSTTVLPVSLINAGSDTLHLGAATVVGEGFTGGMLGPLTLEPGESVEVDVTFNPLVDALYTGEIWVESDAPASPTRGALIGSSLQRPVAVCEADPDEIYAVYESTTWIGHDSYDPSGLRIVDWEWAIVSAPTGSTAAIRGSGADRPDFVPDLVGEYVAELVVTNENGESSLPCLATLNAVPSTDLWVELYWAVANDDMDLHLTNAGGALTSGDDCYYGNCAGRSLDWGVSGASEDDPSLDIDDIPGTGPENINIFRPPEDGFYTVYVHDYTGSTPDFRGENEVTVNIYISGELELTDTRFISGDGDYVPIANIDWASRAAFPL